MICMKCHKDVHHKEGIMWPDGFFLCRVCTKVISQANDSNRSQV